MQDTIQRVAVLFQIELEELVIRCELLWLGHGIKHLEGNRQLPRSRQKVYCHAHNSRSYVTIFYSDSTGGMAQAMRVGILTGGGDCPGLNAVLRAIVRKGILHYRSEEHT